MENCKQQFSVHEIGDFSIESEFYRTNTCLSNKLKISVFIVYLILWSILLFWMLIVLINNCIMTRFKITLVKLLYSLLIFGALGGVISHCLFLSGVQHFAKYLVLPVSTFGVRGSIGFVLKTWFNASLGLTGKTDDKLKKRFTIFLRILNLSIYFSYLICFIIGPMIAVSQGNYLLLNCFLVSGVSIAGMNNLLICITVFYVSRRLVKLCRIDKTAVSDDIAHFCQKMTIINKISILYMFLELAFIMLPFWMFETKNMDTPYGLSNIFYFHFFVYEFGMYSGTFFVFWMISKRGSMIGLGSSKNNESASSQIKSLEIPKMSINDSTTDKIIIDLSKS